MNRHILKCKAAIKGGYDKEIHVWKRNRYKRKKPSLKSNRVAGKIAAKNKKAHAKCVMCLRWFRGEGLIRHLWKCQVKMPCLNRIVEVKTEIKEEPTM